MAIIYRNGMEMFIGASHPNFALVKAEETTGLIVDDQPDSKELEILFNEHIVGKRQD